jgi:excisionase family DNA binding protein
MRPVTSKALAGASGAAMEQNVLREDEILTSEEARRLLKIGRTKLWDLTKRSLIPAYRVGEGRTSGLRYKRSELLRWLDQNRI